MTNWIEWGGGKCPVKVGSRVEVRLRNGEQFSDLAGVGGVYSLDWRHGDDRDIVSYRLLSTDQDTGA